MIIRIFRVCVRSEDQTEFARKFADISVNLVRAAEGNLGVVIGRPTDWTPNEYVMVSKWRDEHALVAFAGENWNRAVIPAGMEPYIKECWIHHYRAFDVGDIGQ